MAVVQGFQWRVQPPRLAEFVGLAGQAKRIHERLGGRVRAWQNGPAGPNTQQVLYTIRVDDWAAWAAFGAKLNEDAEWQGLLQTAVLSPNPAAEMLSNSLVATLPGFEGAPLEGQGGPRLSTVRNFQADRGRRPETLALLTALKGHVGRLGASFRALEMLFAGPDAGTIIVVGEFADAAAFAKFQQKSEGDAKFQAFLGDEMRASTSPLTLVSASIRTELAI